MRTRNTERIDFVRTLNPMSYNIPGHEDRMVAHCERAQAEMRKYRMILKIIMTLYKRAEKEIIKNKEIMYLYTYLLESERLFVKDLKSTWA